MSELQEKLVNKNAIIGIIGLGYVGLPLAIAFSEAGFKVIGFDLQSRKVDDINSGRSYIADVSDERLAKVTSAGLLEATARPERLAEADAICICVPTPLTRAKEPDLSYLRQGTDELAKHLRPGQLVVLESTTYPGTTRELVLPALESSGLKAGLDFYLAYSPERVDPGNKKYGINNTPKIIGAIDTESERLAGILYKQVADTIVSVSSTEVAEMTKLFENVFRNVNIALVNELARLCEKMGISVWEVIDSASTKPFGYMPFYPGPGIGGHCIPLDPHYLASKAREYDFHTRFIELSAEVNEAVPDHVVSLIIEALNGQGRILKGSQVLILGVAYKKESSDTRESPSIKIIQILQKKGAAIRYNDPYIPEIELEGATFLSEELTDEVLSSADCVVIATDHQCYDIKKIVDSSKLVFDCRGATRNLNSENIIRLGE